MGLRTEKQRAQRQQILANAIAMMREHGELPPVREIVRRCAVSEATFFNYFGQREALLGEWAHLELSAHVAAVTDEGPGSLRRAVRQVDRRLAHQLAHEPRMWLRIWMAAPASDPSLGRPGGTRVGAEAAGTTRLAEFGQARGEVRVDRPAEDLGRTLASAWIGALSWEARLAAGDARRDDGEPALAPEAWKRIESAVELVIDGLGKRHERVRLRSQTAPAVRPPPG